MPLHIAELQVVNTYAIQCHSTDVMASTNIASAETRIHPQDSKRDDRGLLRGALTHCHVSASCETAGAIIAHAHI